MIQSPSCFLALSGFSGGQSLEVALDLVEAIHAVLLKIKIYTDQ